ncbi:MAG: hypothetical protein R2795_26820 [Saprospiraceae bacterium]
MQAVRYAEKIRNLVGKGETSQAISELSQLANSSAWLHGVILQSARFSNINRQLLLGLVPFETATIELNKINNAILEITKEIETNTSKDFSIAINEFENRTPKEQLKDVVEIVYSVANDILYENQTILTQIFGQSASKLEIANRMTEVFHQQKSRGSFSRWITYLEETAKNNKNQNEIKQEAKNLALVLDDLHKLLYSYIPNFNPEKLKGDLEFRIDTKFIMSRLFDFEDAEAKEIVHSYLERFRLITQKIGAIAERVNLIVEEEKIVSIKSSNSELYETAHEIFKPFKILDSQIITLIKNNKLNREEFNRYFNLTNQIHSEILEIRELKRNRWLNNSSSAEINSRRFIDETYNSLTIEKLLFTKEKLQSYKSEIKWVILRDKFMLITAGICLAFFVLFKSCNP